MNGLSTGSREPSPLAMVTSHESSPNTFFATNSPSPTTSNGYDKSSMLGFSSQTHTWTSTSFDFPHNKLVSPPQGISGLTPSSMNNMASPFSPAKSPTDSTTRSILTIHPTPLKSRVETQIPIKMTLYPVPAGVTKLHLPTHTISKPKLLSKPKPEKSPDMLELHTTLVCTSAMQSPGNLKRALDCAAGLEVTPKKEERRSSAGDATDGEVDENSPLNGG